MDVADPVEFRVREGTDGAWYVDYHHGIYADTRARHITREAAEQDAERFRTSLPLPPVDSRTGERQ